MTLLVFGTSSQKIILHFMFVICHTWSTVFRVMLVNMWKLLEEILLDIEI